MTEHESNTRAAAALFPDLADCKARIAKMCSERRGPRMSIPVHPDDDDEFICRTIDAAIAALTTPAQENGSASEGAATPILDERGNPTGYHRAADGSVVTLDDEFDRADASPKPQGGAVSEAMVDAALDGGYNSCLTVEEMLVSCGKLKPDECRELVRSVLVAGIAERARASDPPMLVHPASQELRDLAQAALDAPPDTRTVDQWANDLAAETCGRSDTTEMAMAEAVKPSTKCGLCGHDPDPPGADAVAVGEIAEDQAMTVSGKRIYALIVEHDLPKGTKLYTSPPHPSATNNVSHPAVREVTIEDANELVRVFYNWDKSSPREENDNTCFLAALKSIHAVIADAGVTK